MVDRQVEEEFGLLHAAHGPGTDHRGEIVAEHLLVPQSPPVPLPHVRPQPGDRLLVVHRARLVRDPRPRQVDPHGDVGVLRHRHDVPSPHLDENVASDRAVGASVGGRPGVGGPPPLVDDEPAQVVERDEFRDDAVPRVVHHAPSLGRRHGLVVEGRGQVAEAAAVGAMIGVEDDDDLTGGLRESGVERAALPAAGPGAACQDRELRPSGLPPPQVGQRRVARVVVHDDHLQQVGGIVRGAQMPHQVIDHPVLVVARDQDRDRPSRGRRTVRRAVHHRAPRREGDGEGAHQSHDEDE